MSWFAEHVWFVIAAGGVVTWVLCRHDDPFHLEPKASWKMVAWSATGYAAITIPLFYLFDSFLEGFDGKGWMANLLGRRGGERVVIAVEVIFLTVVFGGAGAFHTWRYFRYREILRDCREGKRSAKAILAEMGDK